MEEKSTFSLALKPGLIVSGALVAFSLVLWATVSDINTQKYLGWINYLILAAGYYFYTVQYRNEHKNGALTFGEAFVFMLFMTIVISLVQAVYTYVLMVWLDPAMIQKMLDIATEEMYKKDIPEEQIEQSMKMMSFMFQPWLLAIMSIFSNMFGGIIMSLIIGLFTKKEAPLQFDN
jgi:hypothetical protein